MQARLLTTLVRAATDVQLFLSRASGEAEITDSLTGEHWFNLVQEYAILTRINSLEVLPMRFVAITVIALFWSGASLAQEFLYPKKGQSAEQQSTDKYECHQWAVEQTGFDPMNPPKAPDATPQVAAAPPSKEGGAVRGAARGAAGGAAVGAILGDAGKGAAVGAAAGGIRGRMKRKDADRDQAAAQQNAEDQVAAAARAHEAKIAEERATYDRAKRTCLEARDYSVN